MDEAAATIDARAPDAPERIEGLKDFAESLDRDDDEAPEHRLNSSLIRCHDGAVPYDPSDPRAQLSTAVRSANGCAAGGHVPGAARICRRRGALERESAPGGRVARRWSSATRKRRPATISSSKAPVANTWRSCSTALRSRSTTLRESQSRRRTSGGGRSRPATRRSAIVADGPIVRLFASSTVPALVERCANADDYAERDPNVADFVAWPEPPSGERIRVYRLSDLPLEEGRLGRILRCTTVMVNVLPERRHAARPDQAVPASSRRLRAGVAADPRGLRAPHARAVDAGLVDLARRRTSSLCRAGGGGDPAAADPHESVGRRDAALADRRVRPTAARLLRNGRVGCSTPTTTRCQRPDRSLVVAGQRCRR